MTHEQLKQANELVKRIQALEKLRDIALGAQEIYFRSNKFGTQEMNFDVSPITFENFKQLYVGNCDTEIRKLKKEMESI